MKTTLINYRTYNLDKSKVTPIDRRSIFGNPYILYKENDRATVIKMYETYFINKIKNESKFKEAVEALKGKILGCWCTPLPCHGDVIIEYLEGLE